MLILFFSFKLSYIFSACVSMHYCFLLRCKLRYISNGMWRQALMYTPSAFLREGYSTFYLVNRPQTSFSTVLLVSLVLKTKTVLIWYLAINLKTAHRILHYKTLYCTVSPRKTFLHLSSSFVQCPLLPTLLLLILS